jgi:hypothetical protein
MNTATEQLIYANQIYKRSYEGDNGEVVVVVGTREGIKTTHDYAEAEFVFKNGQLITAHILASGTYVEKVPQCEVSSGA